MTLEEKYNQICSQHATIGEHAPTLRKYAEQCLHITEFGVETIGSTYALMAGKPKQLVSVDAVSPDQVGGNLEEAMAIAKEAGVEFQFIQKDDREITIEPTDLLFIDTLHTYDQLKKELELHASKAIKFIILHDTETYGEVGSVVGCKGLLPALEEFLLTEEGLKWKRIEVFKNMHGLTILGKS